MSPQERPLTPLERLHRLAAILESAIVVMDSAPPSVEPSERREVALRTAQLLAAAELEVDNLLTTAVIEAANDGANWTEIAAEIGYSPAGTRRRWYSTDRDSPQGTRRRGQSPPVVPTVLRELGLDGQDQYDGSTVAPPSSGPDL